MKNIIKYFLISVFILSAYFAFAQNDTIKTKGVRFGVDISQLMVHVVAPNRIGIGAALDYEFKSNFMAVVEGGWLNYNIIDTAAYNYQLNGIYALVGMDYNFFKDEIRVKDDIIFVGFRYGFSQFQHQTDNIVINNYWGTHNGSFEEQRLAAHWFELVFGMKAELFFAKKFFIGWTLRAK